MQRRAHLVAPRLLKSLCRETPLNQDVQWVLSTDFTKHAEGVQVLHESSWRAAMLDRLLHLGSRPVPPDVTTAVNLYASLLWTCTWQPPPLQGRSHGLCGSGLAHRCLSHLLRGHCREGWDALHSGRGSSHAPLPVGGRPQERRHCGLPRS
jgi:hypothetical protein